MKISCLVLLLLLPVLLSAQTGKLRGIVKDADSGNPLENIKVFVKDAFLSAMTDITGTYIILGVPGIKIRVEVGPACKNHLIRDICAKFYIPL